MIVAASLGALFFALAGLIGALVGQGMADRLQRFDDGPTPSNPPVAILIAASALLGAIVAAHGASPWQLPVIAVVVAALVAVWCTDARTGIVPDVFTLVPLALVVTLAVWDRNWPALLGIVLPVAPFAGIALFSRGHGIGWGDVKLVALGAALLGMQISLVMFAMACAAAVAVHYLHRTSNRAIAFAPYLACAIAVGIPIGMMQ